MGSDLICYPNTVKEFRKIFSSEHACVQYLIQSRWPDGFRCPRCEHDGYWFKPSRKTVVCGNCRREISPTAGTLLHRSHVGIQDWFWTAYTVATMTPGLSALQLQRQLGIQYRSAWFMLNRLRKAMVNDARSQLSGLVEADETFIGGTAKNKKGRGVIASPNKSLVVGAVEVIRYVDAEGKQQERAGRLRLSMIADASEGSLGTFVEKNVAPGSRIRTDGWPGYSEAALAEYIHHVRVIGPYQRAHKRLPHIHQVFGNLKIWLNGTHHGVEPKYLQGYLDEFVFRFNRRQTPMAAFKTLLGIASHKTHVSLESMKSCAVKT